MRNQNGKTAVARTSKPRIQWSDDCQVSIVGDLAEIRVHGELNKQLHLAAEHLGTTPEAVLIEAVQESLARGLKYERVEIMLLPEISHWLRRHAKKIGKTPSQIVEALLIQERDFQRETKGFPAEQAAEPTGLIRRN